MKKKKANIPFLSFWSHLNPTHDTCSLAKAKAYSILPHSLSLSLDLKHYSSFSSLHSCLKFRHNSRPQIHPIFSITVYIQHLKT
ncbi:hypothetical protein L6452_19956 [Arctium lappa]|uniref:Uncharacterized protein n=1 Tax=Arctium lappa TaxID=4217 RepID=A0ACB9BBC5_ARCLA|nr:hypothetical protein L6452_19956 [Arctium lappa]